MEPLVVLFLLMVKHAVADLYVQSARPIINKAPYFGGLIHAWDHALLTFAVVVFPAGLQWALIAAIVDFVLHWHIDWAKTNIAHYMKWQRTDTKFWKFQALDQICHYSTYFLIVWIIYYV